jgi:starch synthase
VSLTILHVSSEVAPFAKTGGLGDVASALPRAVAAAGDRVVVVTPRYQIDPTKFGFARRLRKVPVLIGDHYFEVGIFEGRLPGGGGAATVFLLDHPLFDRPGLYHEGGVDYPDNGLRFALLSRGALAIARQLGFSPDVIHAHDWQASPSLLYARRGDEPHARTILTIHNIAFLGQFDASAAWDLGLGADLFHPHGIEFYGKVSFLKAGILFADWVTTVSPRYSREITTPALGAGLDGLLRERSAHLVGILNGADYSAWDPAHDPLLPAHFDADSLDGKTRCKSVLQRMLGLAPRPRVPLFGAVTRLSQQKGFDLVADVIERLLVEKELQLALLGSGDPAEEARLTALAARYPSQLAVRIGYDEQIAHRIYAASDFYLMPSRYEPCGLAQLYALRYGAPPIVHQTGGLDDTVVDFDPRSGTGTGFKFAPLDAVALDAALRRAIAIYHGDPDVFRTLRRRGMAQDFSWRRSAEGYRALYRRAPASSLHDHAA